MSFAEIIVKLEAHFIPKEMKQAKRLIFGSRLQKTGESFKNFNTDLKELASEFQFADADEELLHQILRCLTDRKVVEHLINSTLGD